MYANERGVAAHRAQGKAGRRRSPAVAATVLVLLEQVTLVKADPRLFSDLRPEDLAPRAVGTCHLDNIGNCLAEYHTLRYDSSQSHRSSESDQRAELDLRLKPPHARLLLLFTSVWRNFQRRRLVRKALADCRRVSAISNPSGVVVSKFLLGDMPSDIVDLATQEMTDFEDVMVVGGEDEMEYRHIGDNYVLPRAHPEIRKLILALRRFSGQLRYDFLMLADDDSFVSLPNVLDLLDLLPPERLYVGNMIDSVPQYWSKKDGALASQYEVSMYLSVPGKVPIFAHGMGFIISQDVAKMLADVGLSLKARSNDDVVIGVWLRTIEHLYTLNYHLWFSDHWEFDGVFSKKCEDLAVLIHRMNPQRWRTFNHHLCTLCGEPIQRLDDIPDPPYPDEQEGGSQPSKPRKCVQPKDAGCKWSENLRLAALLGTKGSCFHRCAEQAVTLNNTAQPCRRLLCHTFCSRPCQVEAKGSQSYNRLNTEALPTPPELSICIFGSQWENIELRGHLRRALRACNVAHLVDEEVPHVFLMESLPSIGHDLRASAVREMLLEKDLVEVSPVQAPLNRTLYAYQAAWRFVEELFGGSNFILLLDHRSYVNVPLLQRALLPQLPKERLYAGCLLDYTLFPECVDSGRGPGRCDYIARRRAPMFSHGMGFIVSKDVAQHVHTLSQMVPLRFNDVPADMAYAMWVQAMEDLHVHTVHAHFHEWPKSDSDEGVPWDLTRSGTIDVSQPLRLGSLVVFPMTTQRWADFEAPMCLLNGVDPETLHGTLQIDHAPMLNWARHRRVPGASGASTGEAVQKTQPSPRERVSSSLGARGPFVSAEAENECWKGMGGRPEAWHLVCCHIGWSGCWGGDYDEARCCRQPESPPPPPAARNGEESGLQDLETLRRFLRFTPEELQLFLEGLRNFTETQKEAPDKAEMGSQRFPCLTMGDCMKEAFARFYQRSWEAGVLPLRHPWLTDTQDHLFGLSLKLRSENSGWGPKGHEHTLERVQLAHWLRLCSDAIDPAAVPGERRCFEWDSTQYSRFYFEKHCLAFDHIAFDGEDKATATQTGPVSRRYVVDFHKADAIIPANSVGIVVCVQVFEHLRRPHVGMAQLFRIVAPGGYVVWSAPMFSELHGAPEDFFRYTAPGARALAEDAGFTVIGISSPGGLRELAGYLLGVTAPYWEWDSLVTDTASTWPLQIYMLLQKPGIAVSGGD